MPAEARLPTAHVFRVETGAQTDLVRQMSASQGAPDAALA